MVYNENNKDNIHCDYECCQCKKIFMILVILILTFMAGIMVGNCGRCRYSDTFYNKHHQLKNHHNKNFIEECTNSLSKHQMKTLHIPTIKQVAF